MIELLGDTVPVIINHMQPAFFFVKASEKVYKRILHGNKFPHCQLFVKSVTSFGNKNSVRRIGGLVSCKFVFLMTG